MIQHFNKKSIFTIEIEVIPLCNFSCEYCENRYELTYNTSKKFSVDFEALYQFIQKIKKIKQNIKLKLNGGEPTLHNQLLLFGNK